MKLFLLIALVFLGAVPRQPASAQAAKHSANAILPGCRAFVSALQGKPIPDDAFLNAGVCAGKISALINVRNVLDPKYRFCPPEGGTLLQTLEVALKGIETKPEHWHEPFEALALVALINAWPCK